MFVGSGVYHCVAGHITVSGRVHTVWLPEDRSHLDWLEKVIADNQGNFAQFWGFSPKRSPKAFARSHALEDLGITPPETDWENRKFIKADDWPESQHHHERNGAGLLKVIKEAASKGIYSAFLYADALPEWSQKFKEAGKYYLGYDFGEIFTFRLEEAHLSEANLDKVTLKTLADDFIAKVRCFVDKRKAAGWGNIMATSSNFYIDYEIAAGADIPVIEDFAFSHLNMASAISRGLCRQYQLPYWGSHLAHEHYSWIPYSSPYKFPLLKAAMYLKYMSGSRMILNESGNWYLQAQLCTDSPMFETPRVELGSISINDPELSAPLEKEARKSYNKINYNSPAAQRYRKEISDFYNFVKTHGTPEGQPETTIAIAKGNLDLCYHEHSPNTAVAGMFTLAEKNPAWFEGAPERGWNIVKNVFFPRPPVLAPYHNRFLSGTPYGMVDIVSFAEDHATSDFLSSHYKALLFSGWNTCSEKQYKTLREFVLRGGTLFISIPHFSKNISRNYSSYSVEELVNGGDLSDLCGVVVKGKGRRFYWATAPDRKGELGFKIPRRFGIMTTCMGDIEITGKNIDILAVDDEEMEPVLLRHRLGKGTVYFLNSWAYPGAMDVDEGPGSTIGSNGLISAIYRHIARHTRGQVWMTDDGQDAGPECNFISYSYFPDAGKIYLLNVDFDRSHRVQIHHFGLNETIILNPGEFRILDTVRISQIPQ